MILIRDTGVEYPASKLNSAFYYNFQFLSASPQNKDKKTNLRVSSFKLKGASSARNNFKNREKAEKAPGPMAIKFGQLGSVYAFTYPVPFCC